MRRLGSDQDRQSHFPAGLRYESRTCLRKGPSLVVTPTLEALVGLMSGSASFSNRRSGRRFWNTSPSLPSLHRNEGVLRGALWLHEEMMDPCRLLRLEEDRAILEALKMHKVSRTDGRVPSRRRTKLCGDARRRRRRGQSKELASSSPISDKVRAELFIQSSGVTKQEPLMIRTASKSHTFDDRTPCATGQVQFLFSPGDRAIQRIAEALGNQPHSLLGRC